MGLIRTFTSFGTVFPAVSRVSLVLAILLWGKNIGQSILEGKDITVKPQSKGISWQDITPTCDVVISDIAREQATITSWLNKCRNDGSLLVDLDTALLHAKKTLRMTNIDSIEDSDLRDALLKLRRQQIVDYTTMRKNLRPFLDTDVKTEKTLTDTEERLQKDFIKESERSLSSFSLLMVEFAIAASILPDEIEDERARNAIFSVLE